MANQKKVTKLTTSQQKALEGMSVSNQIRLLNKEGMSRADIARALNKRYQHIKNVLDADQQKKAQ